MLNQSKELRQFSINKMHSILIWSFSKESEIWSILIPEYPNLAQNDGRVAYASEAKKSEFLVHLDHFLKFLKYFKYFEKQSKCTKNSDFFATEAYTTLSHHFEQS